jgi:hypothetical protein
MRTKHPGLGVEHRFHKAFDLARPARSLAVADEGELADLDLMARLLALASVNPTLATCGWQ